MANLGDGFKDIFFAGIGAMALTGEKAKKVVDQLIAKGELTVDQGKQINTELTHKTADVVTSVRNDLLEARMAAMSPEERQAFAAKVAELAAKPEAPAADAAEAAAPETTEAAAPTEADAPAQTPGA